MATSARLASASTTTRPALARNAGAADAASLYRDLAARPCDAVVLDPDLPGENGYSVATYLRDSNRVGIVMLSREASLERDSLPIPWLGQRTIEFTYR